MRYKFAKLGILLVLALGARAPAQCTATGQTFWKGSSAGYQVEWTSGDLKAVDSKTGHSVFSAREVALANFDHVKRRLQPGETYEEDYELLSLVGSVLSVEYHARIFNGNGRNSKTTVERGVTRYVALDLQNPGASVNRLTETREESIEPASSCVKLSEFFGDKELLAAFNNDTVIQSTIDTSTISTLPDLVKALKGKSLPAPDMCGRFDSNLLNEFGVHHLRGTKAAIRLGVSGVDPHPETLSELGMVLPIPESLQAKFSLASEGKEGVLMGALKRKTGKARTHFEFKSERSRSSLLRQTR